MLFWAIHMIVSWKFKNLQTHKVMQFKKKHTHTEIIFINKATQKQNRYLHYTKIEKSLTS